MPHEPHTTPLRQPHTGARPDDPPDDDPRYQASSGTPASHQTPSSSETPSLLPGVAAICLFLILSTTLNVYGALSGVFGQGRARGGILALCSLLAVGIFGLLRLRKWGWALVTAGCLLLAAGDLIFFTRVHTAFFLVRGLLTLVFFLYLVRPETRDHLR
ncbi:MAG: hypothetical protein M3O02_11060 [Acidobacteriota bacterium]|nr:hypothetical protein [Acidobacteriota bacterium]